MGEGAPALGELIMFVGILMVGFIIVYIFTTQVITPGLGVAGDIEDVSLANSIASTVNALSTVDRGDVQMAFSKQFNIRSVSSSGNLYLKVGEKQAPVLADLDMVNLLSNRIKIVKERGSGTVKIKGVQ